MSTLEGRPLCSGFRGIRSLPPAPASEDRDVESLDERGLELDEWGVEKQEGEYST